MDWPAWAIWLAAAYLIGAIPFGLLLGKARGVDIREHGSGNVGATNVGRVLGKKLGLLCFGLDVLKGLGPTLGYGLITGSISTLAPEAFAAYDGHSSEGIASGNAQGIKISATAVSIQWLAIAMAAIFGHIFPIYLKLRGGKGVATSLGALLGLFPYLTLPALLGFVVWYVVVKASGYVGLASVAAALVLPVLTVVSGLMWGLEAGPILVFGVVTVLLAALVVVRHRGNLKRILAGTEPKAGWATRPPADNTAG